MHDYGRTPVIGVLALQGGFAEHVAAFRSLGAVAREVRLPAEMEGLDGLVLPGGESTAIGIAAESAGLIGPLRQWVHGGRPSWGTCAGLILLAERVDRQQQGGQPLLGGLDVTVDRNHFGSQLQSFEGMVDTPSLDPRSALEIFIRAPAITWLGAGVDPIGTLSGTATRVAVRQHNLLGTAFHPELTSDRRWHRLFLAMSAT